MRQRLASVLLGLGLAAMASAPGWACSFHDQAAADSQTQQQTADAQPPSQTSTQ